MPPQKTDGPALGPRAVASRPLEEAGVAALGRKVDLQPGRAEDGGFRQCRRWNERIVERVDQERRPADLRQVGSAARLRPVVALIRESEDAGGDEAVVLGERPRAEGRAEIDATPV